MARELNFSWANGWFQNILFIGEMRIVEIVRNIWYPINGYDQFKVKDIFGKELPIDYDSIKLIHNDKSNYDYYDIEDVKITVENYITKRMLGEYDEICK